MERNEIWDLISSDEKSLTQSVYNFIEKYNQVQIFPELDNDNLRTKLWSAIFTHLTNKQLKSAFVPCLTTIRILSRDKTNLNDLINEDWINTLLKLSGLQKPEKILEQRNIPPDYDIIIEALKCLCNLVFNSHTVQRISIKNGTLEGIIKRLLTYSDLKIPHDVKYFDMKLLFIITALCAEVRPKLKEELHGVIYLMEILDVILKESFEDQNVLDTTANKLTLTDAQVNLSCEILKVLYNLTVKSNFTVSIDEEEEAHYIRLVIILHDLLLRQTESTSKTTELHSHVINLLTALPPNCLRELATPVPNTQELIKDFEYDGYSMEAIYILLTFLKNRLNNDPAPRGQNELLSPILIVLLMCANISRLMRKYLRYQILPPLRDVLHRPEQGSTLRNHLCRMLTTPVTEVRDLAAELLFVLCKENVARMIKYTGYGNAAGLFANRGLMGRTRNENDAKYSSESEDSDTEEYKQYRHGINEVMGCYEPPHPNPTAGMTEEQKEYEAMKLVNLMHDLTSKGIIQPCKVGEDGKPVPVDNILQLQEELP